MNRKYNGEQLKTEIDYEAQVWKPVLFMRIKKYKG